MVPIGWFLKVCHSKFPFQNFFDYLKLKNFSPLNKTFEDFNLRKKSQKKWAQLADDPKFDSVKNFFLLFFMVETQWQLQVGN